MLISEEFCLQYELDEYCQKNRFLAFKSVVEHWNSYDDVIEYLCNKIKNKPNGKYNWERWTSSGIYMEGLSSIAESEKLKIKIYKSLVSEYNRFTDLITDTLGVHKIDSSRRKVMLSNLEKAIKINAISDKVVIEKIRHCLVDDNNIEKIITQLDALANRICQLSAQEYEKEFQLYDMAEIYEELTETQSKQYQKVIEKIT